MSKGAQITLGAIAITLLIGWYGWTQLGEITTFRYYQNLEEFRSADAAMSGKPARLHGYVAKDSIVRDVQARRVHFAVQSKPPHSAGDAEDPLPILYSSLETPDLFKEGAEVVVEGHLEVEGSRTVFVANNVMAKCPSKFEAGTGLAEAEGPTGTRPEGASL